MVFVSFVVKKYSNGQAESHFIFDGWSSKKQGDSLSPLPGLLTLCLFAWADSRVQCRPETNADELIGSSLQWEAVGGSRPVGILETILRVGTGRNAFIPAPTRSLDNPESRYRFRQSRSSSKPCSRIRFRSRLSLTRKTSASSPNI